MNQLLFPLCEFAVTNDVIIPRAKPSSRL